MRPCVFLDRDDTLIDTAGATRATASPGDLTSPDQVHLLPGVAEACGRLAGAGLTLVVISNQGAVARGVASLDMIELVNQRLFELLHSQQHGPELLTTHPHVSIPRRPSLLAGVYFCPFHPNGVVPEFSREHAWRKPAPGMLLAAASDLDLDLSRSWLIGDAQRDVDAGISAGLAPSKCLRLEPGHFDTLADHVLEGADAHA